MLIPKKSLGQNFLIDKNIITKIINLGNIYNRNIIEIGPGTGQLTEEIIRRKPKKLLLIEKDNILCQKLKIKYKDLKNVEVLNFDALLYDFNIFKKPIIISNTPYNISSKIIQHLLIEKNNFSKMIFMFQKEFAYKLLYSKNKKLNKYNLYVEMFAKYKIEFNVSNNVFYPKPKVSSCIVSFEPKKLLINRSKFLKFSNLIFRNKRKKIKSNIKIINENKKIKDILNKRVENLKINEIIILFNKF